MLKKLFGIKQLLMAGIVLSMVACNSNHNELYVFAAAGTRLVTDSVCNQFESSNHEVVQRNYASSGTLAKQIAAGAPCDVYLSANKQWIDFLVDQNMLKRDNVALLAGNSLVWVAPKSTKPDSIRYSNSYNWSWLANNKIVIGDPGYVPVGKYSKQLLDNMQWYDGLKDQMVLAKDVSSVLHYVELGECSLGLVYKTEALRSQKVKIVSEVPDSLHQDILFYVGVLNQEKAEVTLLKDQFISDNGKSIFKDFGFKIME